MGIFLAVLGFFQKVLDILNPWSSYWANKAKSKDDKRDIAQKNLDKAVKSEKSDDDFLDAVNDKLGA